MCSARCAFLQGAAACGFDKASLLCPLQVTINSSWLTIGLRKCHLFCASWRCAVPGLPALMVYPSCVAQPGIEGAPSHATSRLDRSGRRPLGSGGRRWARRRRRCGACGCPRMPGSMRGYPRAIQGGGTARRHCSRGQTSAWSRCSKWAQTLTLTLIQVLVPLLCGRQTRVHLATLTAVRGPKQALLQQRVD